MVARILSKAGKKGLEAILKQNPSMSKTEATKELNKVLRGAAGSKPKPKPKPKPKAKAKATGTGLSKPTVEKNKNKSKYEANMAKMGGGQKVGSDAGRKTAMKGRELQDAWQGLTKGDQRYERTLGKKSKFYSIIKKLDAKPKRKPLTGPNTSGTKAPIDTSNFGDVSKAGRLKAGGKVMKRKAGGSLKNVPADNKGLAKLPTKVRNDMGYAKGGGKVMKYKKGGMVYMKNGGVVKASKDGDDLVSSCYD
jgi:hypothetical protein